MPVPPAPAAPTAPTTAPAAFPATRHTLANGLTVYLSPHAAEPRIYTQVAVRAGSKHDPDRSTGLAHYLEHMLFKGTDRLGTRDWAAEEPLLREIADAYEAHRATDDPAERRRLYARIDELSQRAAAYALPGEYDRITAQMGARGTNAYTWVDQTVFINDIPAGELARWARLEAERFSRLVLRLFHTELETVFEEFNITQDKDFRKVMRAANAALFGPHPYGTHTTIGEGEHLKAPSHHDIYDFFARHYVPANMAVVLAGDFEPARALAVLDDTFGRWTPRPVPPYEPVSLPPISAPATGPADETAPRSLAVYGQEAPAAYLHYRLPGAASREALVAQVAVGMLSNRQAGLFDQALVREQRVLSATASITPMAEYGVWRAAVKPRADGTLEDAVALALGQVARLAAGDYPDWLREAVLVDHELTITRSAESNQGRAGVLTSAFIYDLPLERALARAAELRSVTDEEIQAFAKTYLAPARAVCVYKRQGDDPDVMKVDKPAITPVPLNTEEVSRFAERLLALDPEQTRARFADLDAAITRRPLRGGVELHHLRNAENRLFELLYVFDFGTHDDRWIGYATKYLGFLGTERLSNEDVQVAFYRLGLEYQVQASAHRTYVGVNGLDAHLAEGVALLDELLRTCLPDAEKWAALTDDIAQRRANDRADKQVVLRKGLAPYARFGSASPMARRPSVAELRERGARELVAAIHALADTPHAVFYYGPRDVDEAASVLTERLPSVPATRLVERTPSLPVERPEADRVLFTHLPMVQVEVLALRHVAEGFRAELWPLAEWFNQYYGLGLSSVVFQELRESRALAYSTYAYAETPPREDGHHWLQAFIGTQPDKLATALEAMRSLLRDWRFDETAAERVREGMLQQMRTERDLRQSRYWLWRRAADRGLEGNPRQFLYERLRGLSPQQLLPFYERLAAAPTTFVVLGDRERVDLDLLRAVGDVREVTLDEAMP